MTRQSDQHQTIKAHIQGVFERAAPTYDQVGARFFAHFGQRLVDVAALERGSTVLDVATGRGAVLFPASTAVGPEGHVTGIDFALAMITATSAEATARGLGNVTLQPMDIEALTFPDAQFDAVLCGFAIFFLLPRFDPGMAEIRRVVRPGGRFACSTWMAVFGPDFDWLEPLQTEFLPPQRLPAYTGSGTPPVFTSAEGLATTITNAGFTDVQVLTETAQFTYPTAEAWWAALWSHGMRGWLEALEQQQGAAALQRFKIAVFGRLTAQMMPAGIVQTASVLYAVARRPLA